VSAIRCVIWILGALLVLATLDSVPDPPAANPISVKSGTAVAAPGALAPDIRGVTLPSALSVPIVCFTASRGMQTDSRTRQPLTLTEQAADASPPLFPA
jgi:hypothetical protein